jgi:hypothetical protein
MLWYPALLRDIRIICEANGIVHPVREVVPEPRMRERTAADRLANTLDLSTRAHAGIGNWQPDEWARLLENLSHMKVDD